MNFERAISDQVYAQVQDMVNAYRAQRKPPAPEPPAPVPKSAPKRNAGWSASAPAAKQPRANNSESVAEAKASRVDAAKAVMREALRASGELSAHENEHQRQARAQSISEKQKDLRIQNLEKQLQDAQLTVSMHQSHNIACSRCLVC